MSAVPTQSGSTQHKTISEFNLTAETRGSDAKPAGVRLLVRCHHVQGGLQDQGDPGEHRRRYPRVHRASARIQREVHEGQRVT